MKKHYDRPIFLRAVKALVKVTLSDSFRIRPHTEVSSVLIVQPAAKIQSPEPRVECILWRWVNRNRPEIQGLKIRAAQL